jgi:hypothetical protein
MSMSFDTPDWRSMSQQDLDLGLNNGVAVPASAGMVAGWDNRSAEMRARYSSHLDLRYGPRERNRISESPMVGRRCCSSTAATGRPGRRRRSPFSPVAQWRMASMSR